MDVYGPEESPRQRAVRAFVREHALRGVVATPLMIQLEFGLGGRNGTIGGRYTKIRREELAAAGFVQHDTGEQYAGRWHLPKCPECGVTQCKTCAYELGI